LARVLFVAVQVDHAHLRTRLRARRHGFPDCALQSRGLRGRQAYRLTHQHPLRRIIGGAFVEVAWLADGTRTLHSGRGPALLDHVRELVSEQPPAVLRVRRIPIRAEHDIAAERERQCVHAPRCGIGAGVCMYPHRSEVDAVARLEEAAHDGLQRTACAEPRRDAVGYLCGTRSAVGLALNLLLVPTRTAAGRAHALDLRFRHAHDMVGDALGFPLVSVIARADRQFRLYAQCHARPGRVKRGSRGVLAVAVAFFRRRCGFRLRR